MWLQGLRVAEKCSMALMTFLASRFGWPHPP